LDHYFTSHVQREVETHILKLDWSRNWAKLISRNKKIKFEYSFEIIGWEIREHKKDILLH
jgi:hypothetical protein